MTFTPWLGVKAFGYAGTEPNARFGTATLAAYATSWGQPEWRYDDNRIQVRGLYKTTAAQGGSDPVLIFRHRTILAPTRRIILPTMVNMQTTNGYQEFARVDLAPHADGFQLTWSSAWAPNTAYFWLEMDIDLSFFTSGN